MGFSRQEYWSGVPLSSPSASVRSIPFLSFIVPIFAGNVPLVSLIFLKKSLVFPISIVFLYFFALITEDDLFLSLLAILWDSAFGWIFPFSLCLSLLFFSQLFVRPPQTAILLFAFLFLGNDLDPVS